jgi:hypothetical protein
MKKLLVSLLVVCGMVGMMAGTALAYTYGTYGELDTLLEKVNLDNSGKDEQAWLNDYFNTTVSYVTYDSVVDNWDEIATGVFALELKDSPTYFFIKVGVGRNDPPYDHLLFLNNLSLSYALLALDGEGYSIKNIGKVSHVGEIGDDGGGGGEGGQVPEPGTLMLLGSGLLGLAFYGRRLRK